MKTFWKDYGETMDYVTAFFNKHWKGCVLIYAVAFVPIMIVAYKDKISKYLKTKFGKKEES